MAVSIHVLLDSEAGDRQDGPEKKRARLEARLFFSFTSAVHGTCVACCEVFLSSYVLSHFCSALEALCCCCRSGPQNRSLK